MNTFGIIDPGLFCAAVFLLNITPGPDTAYIVGRSVAQGRAAGLVSALGISAGCCLHAIASAFGLTAILAASATAFTVVKLAGGAYLIYLGVRLLMTRASSPTPASGLNRPPAPLALGRIFMQAVVTNVLNPKVILFFMSFFPQFVRADAPDKPVAFLLLGAIFVLMSTAWNSGTALAAGMLTAHAGRNPRVRLWLERSVGTAFVALGLRLATTRQ